MRPLLELVGIEVAHGERVVLQGVDLALLAGEVVGLLGPNGAGKSTLIRVAAGLWRPRAGAVRLLGDPAGGLSRREVARRAALVPQDTPVEFAFSVRELVEMGRYAHAGRFSPYGTADREAVEAGMRAADIETLAERRIDTLSGGERRLAVFARALAQHAPLLLLDEPTAGLDLAHRAMLLDRIDRHARGAGGALVALHDLTEARAVCDRVLLLDRGRVAACGPPAEVLTDEMLRAVYRALPEDVARARRGEPRSVV